MGQGRGNRLRIRSLADPQGDDGGISSKVLTETPRRLQSNGLVDRLADPEAPSRVEYQLTALGRTLLGAIDAVGAWAFEYGDEVVAAQEAARTADPRSPRAPRPGPNYDTSPVN
ncbi:winged helix-turn-helix transcriptional regulator [Streptomyces sp. NPDC018026]|uniref:winged helix-turn-helix transcriptional regulator n=1 Tax=Streptomyces sp. NPDC018026 TaxID=3365031 RepID=UPI00379557A4